MTTEKMTKGELVERYIELLSNDEIYQIAFDALLAESYDDLESYVEELES